MRIGGPRAAGYREGGERGEPPAPEAPVLPPSFLRRRYYGWGILALFFDVLLVGSLAFLTWHRLDVACSRSGPRDLRCKAVTDRLFQHEERVVDLYGTASFVVWARDEGVGGKRNLRNVLTAITGKGRRTELGQHPHAEWLVTPLSEFLADPARPTVEVSTGRPRVAYGAATVFWVVAAIAVAFAAVSSQTLRVVGGDLRIERRYLPGVTRTRVIPCADIVRFAHDGPGQLAPLFLVLADGEHVPVYRLASVEEVSEVARLVRGTAG